MLFCSISCFGFLRHAILFVFSLILFLPFFFLFFFPRFISLDGVWQNSLHTSSSDIPPKANTTGTY
jgi:hypothetical protein